MSGQNGQLATSCSTSFLRSTLPLLQNLLCNPLKQYHLSIRFCLSPNKRQTTFYFYMVGLTYFSIPKELDLLDTRKEITSQTD